MPMAQNLVNFKILLFDRRTNSCYGSTVVDVLVLNGFGLALKMQSMLHLDAIA